MLILALDSATRGCSVALLRDEMVLESVTQIMQRGQSEALLPMLREMMVRQGIGFDQLDLIAVTTGPGAFTGLRIALSAARGLAVALDKPCVGVNVFAALAFGHRPCHVVIDSKRAELFYGFVDADGQVLDEKILTASEIAAILPPGDFRLAGCGAAAVMAVLPPEKMAVYCEETELPNPAAVALLGRADFMAGNHVPPVPHYLRAPDAVPSEGPFSVSGVVGVDNI